MPKGIVECEPNIGTALTAREVMEGFFHVLHCNLETVGPRRDMPAASVNDKVKNASAMGFHAFDFSQTQSPIMGVNLRNAEICNLAGRREVALPIEGHDVTEGGCGRSGIIHDKAGVCDLCGFHFGESGSLGVDSPLTKDTIAQPA